MPRKKQSASPVMGRPRLPRTADRGEDNRVKFGVGIRATQAWLDWLHRAATHAGVKSLPEFLAAAAARYAAQSGFAEPPPRRLGD